MLKSQKLMAFIATSAPEKALAFYRDVLELELVADEPFAIVFDAHGTMLRIQKATGHQPLPYTALGWEVSDMASMVDGLLARGVHFERFDGFEQDARGIWKVPNGTQVAWFKDPDGNLLSLTQF